MPLRTRLARSAWALSRPVKSVANAIAGRFVVWLLRAIRRTDPARTTDLSGRFLRTIGPWLPEHRTGRANLTAAFPDKQSAEIEEILRGVWDNLGRVAAEFAHLDRLSVTGSAGPGPAHIDYDAASLERVRRLNAEGKPALVFAAHLANWEIPAMVAVVAGVDSAVLYRRPNVAHVAETIRDIRSAHMGTLIPAGPAAVFQIAGALSRGASVGILVDQHFHRGVEVTFFGRRCKANPMIARLARQFDCPIHGTRAIRLQGLRFRVELTEPIEPPRDAEGRIDVEKTMQAITDVVEGWVREHPEQWLWLHRRWRT